MKKTTLLITACCVGLGATAQAALWTPMEITTASWYDAADASTITATGSDVTALADKSGNNRDLAVGANNNSPTTGINMINGLNVLTFSNSGGTSYQALWDTSATGFTMVQYFAVAQYTTPTTSNRPTIIGDKATTNYALQLVDADVNGVPDGISAFTSQMYENGSATNANLATLAADLASPTLVRRDATMNNFQISLGSDRTQNSRSHNGYIAEFIAFETALTEEDRLKVEGYLAWKWGLEELLPSDHLYANAAPTGIPEFSSAILGGIGCLLLLRRRRA